MDIKTLLNNLHEEVSCSVCMTTFTDPKMLPCLHSFCLHCLNGILRTSGRHHVITCPECRGESRVPNSGNLNDLPTNFRINSLLDVLAIKERNTAGIKCGNCDKKSSQSVYCFQCCAFWCDDCITAHNIIRANKDHRVLAIKDFQDQDIEEVLKRPAFCRKPGHEKKELEFFCKICEVPICNSCALTDHEGHPKMLLEEAANERRLQVKSAIKSQKEKVQMKKNEITKLDENCDKIQEQVANVKRRVQQFAENIIQVVDAKKQEIINEVENQAKESLHRLEIKKSTIEHEVKMTEETLDKTETLLKRSPSAEIMQPNKFLNKIFQGEVGQKHSADCGDGIFLEFDFVKNQALLEIVSAENIGSFKRFLTKTRPHLSSAEGKGINEAFVGLEAEFVLTTRNAEGEQCYDEHDCVTTVEVRNFQGHDCATKARVEDNKGGNYKISYFAKQTGNFDLTVKVNEEYVRGNPFSVEVKPRQFRPVLSFGQEGSAVGMLRRPWGVAVNERNEIAVTEIGNNRVQLFSSDGTYLRVFGRPGYKQGQFSHPSGIAFDIKNGNILVADCKNHRIQLFSGKGEYLSQFGGKGNHDHQLMSPQGLSVNCDGNIIVADVGDKLVKIFSQSGQLLQKIGGEGSFTFPVHCVQYEKYLIVSDMGDHCVKVLDRDGNFLYKFGKKGFRNGEFTSPFCLSVDRAGHLMVCNKSNHRVQVFELSGKFITKFGTQGSVIGEFNQPGSTTVLSDGRIVVIDYCNHRIQIFE